MRDEFFKIFLCCFILADSRQCYAFNYRLGIVPVSKTDEKVVIRAKPSVNVAILPGGRNWPPLFLDEAGRIYAGSVVIEGTTGRTLNFPKGKFALPHDVILGARGDGFQLQHAGKSCFFPLQQLGLSKQKTALATLKDSNIRFSGAGDGLLALGTQFGADCRVANYRIEQLDLGDCQISFRHEVGNPDLLVELGHSTKGGWWLTGSIEQTLLQSSNGRDWRKAALPPGLSSLISAYVASEAEIWLAGILAGAGDESPYLLVYSNDSGRSWRNVVANDPVLDRLPAGWLEGQKRRAQQ